MKFFVPGVLVNHANVHVHWARERKYARVWRSAVTFWGGRALRDAKWAVPATTPKRIRFHCIVEAYFDLGGLWRALKPVQDALMANKTYTRKGLAYVLHGLPVVDDDGPRAPHAWPTPTQEVKKRRKPQPDDPPYPMARPYLDPKRGRLVDHRGVWITIELKEAGDDDRGVPA